MTSLSGHKPSSLRFVRSIPAHWIERRAKFLFKEVNERSSDGTEELLSVSHITGVTRRSEKNVTMIMAETTEGYKVCRPGDLAINTLWAWMGALGVSKEHGVVSPAYGVYRQREPKTYRDRFVDLLLRTPMLVAEYNTRSRGVQESRLRLYPESFLDIPLPCPSLDEQDAIVRFLENKERDIEQYLATKRRMIEVLEEQTSLAVRHEVFGLKHQTDDSVSAEIDYLPRIPRGWQACRVKDEFRLLNHRRVPLSSEQRGRMKTREFDYYGASGVIDRVDNYLFDDSLLLIAEDGANLLLRNLPLAIIARGRFWVNNHAHILKPIRGCLEYLAMLMESLRYDNYITGAAQPKMTAARLMSIPIPVPPMEVQFEIASRLSEQLAQTHSAIKLLNREIAVMEEYRTRLIADAVTGQIDVRRLG